LTKSIKPSCAEEDGESRYWPSWGVAIFLIPLAAAVKSDKQTTPTRGQAASTPVETPVDHGPLFVGSHVTRQAQDGEGNSFSIDGEVRTTDSTITKILWECQGHGVSRGYEVWTYSNEGLRKALNTGEIIFTP
jgi:hypothetical protein